MDRSARIIAVAAAMLVSTSAHAQQPPQVEPAQPGPAPAPPEMHPGALPAVPGAQLRDTTIHRHLGFFIRPDLGLGYMSVSGPTGTSAGDMTISGMAGLFGLLIGGAVSENLILAGHIYDAVISDPSVSTSSGQSGSSSNTTMALFGFGPDFTYYWMPSNVYFTGSLALTRLTLTVNGQDANSEYGIGGRIGFGKEWWVSDHWGLGVAGHLSVSTNKDSGSNNAATLSSWAIGATFSATYN